MSCRIQNILNANLTWRQVLTNEKRRYLIKKISNTIIDNVNLTLNTTTYSATLFENIPYLIKYSMNIEHEIYLKANDLEGYFHLLAERIYLTQKRLEGILPIIGNSNNSSSNNINIYEYLMEQQQQIQQNTSLNLNEISIATTQRQITHLNITNKMRKHLLKRLIATILSPSADLKYINDSIMIENLIKHAKYIENRIFTNSRSKNEYFHSLAEYIYKTQKFLKLKQREQYDRLIKTSINLINFDTKTNHRE